MIYGSGKMRCMAMLWSASFLVAGASAYGAEVLGEGAQQRVLVDKVIAVVEEDVITLRSLEKLAAGPLKDADRYDNPTEREARRRAILLQALDTVLSEKMIEMLADIDFKLK